MKTYIGKCGLKYTIEKIGGQWVWRGQDGCGFSNESLEYIMEYLVEVMRIKK